MLAHKLIMRASGPASYSVSQILNVAWSVFIKVLGEGKLRLGMSRRMCVCSCKSVCVCVCVCVQHCTKASQKSCVCVCACVCVGIMTFTQGLALWRYNSHGLDARVRGRGRGRGRGLVRAVLFCGGHGVGMVTSVHLTSVTLKHIIRTYAESGSQWPQVLCLHADIPCELGSVTDGDAAVCAFRRARLWACVCMCMCVHMHVHVHVCMCGAVACMNSCA